MELVQVQTRIDASKYDPMSRRNPVSRYWKVFTQWKKLFKEQNQEHLSGLTKPERGDKYRIYFEQYFSKHYTASV